MPRREIQIVRGEFYHIVKRGIDEKEIFLDDEDRLRFINSLLVFNDKNYSPWEFRFFWYRKSPKDLTLKYVPKEPLVEIHAFALMPNHFHLLVKEIVENGISLFMQKLGGYSLYFNKKYQREGTLFPRRYKIVHISGEEHLKNVFVYIHTNPVALIEPSWKDWEVKNEKKVIEFLEKQYRWSSYFDYLGKKNFPNLVYKKFFMRLFENIKGIQEEINAWVKFKSSNFKQKKELKVFFLE